MANIASITLSYVTDEDRIHLAARMHDATTVRFWLTQRMARSLVRALGTYMEKAEGIPLATVRQAVMAQAQAQAVAAIRREQPVVAKAEAPAHLITTIRLNLLPDHVGLRFESGLDFSPAVTLDRTMVRQWLSMLQRQFEKGGWPLDTWPAWMLEGNAAPESDATRH
jgi:hypothetical protein